MTVIITGAAGFIGANFTFHMLDLHKDLRIVALDKLTYAGDLSTLKPAFGEPNFRFVKADICDRESVYRLFEEERPDIVVNFAAESHVDRSISDPEVFLRTNVLGVGVLLDACLKYGVSRYHQVSTDEVYGSLPLSRPDLKFSEQSPLSPSSPYSSSKAAADLLVMSYFRTYGLSATISRCSNNYGRFQFPEKLIPLTISNALSDKPVPVYGSGENIRDWIHVSDHCRAVETILFYGKPGEVYNIGGGEEVQNIDLVRALLSLLGKPENLIRHVSDRPGHDLRYAVDSSKMRSEFGWSPATALSEGLKSTVEWYLGHRDWLDEILSGEYKRYNM